MVGNSLARAGKRGEVQIGRVETVSNVSETASRRAPNPRDKAFIVQCKGFRCMAFRDSSGKWRDYFNGEELHGEVTVISEE